MHLHKKIMQKHRVQTEDAIAQPNAEAESVAPPPKSQIHSIPAPVQGGAAQQTTPSVQQAPSPAPPQTGETEAISSRYEMQKAYNSSQEFTKFTTEFFPQPQISTGLPLPLGVFVKPLGSSVT